MLKNILNLDGAQKLTETEQKSINGAGPKLELCPEDSHYVACMIPLHCTLGANGWYCA